MNKVIYFWNEGPDSRHLTTTIVCRTLREAKAYIKTIGEDRAYKITRQDELGTYAVLQRVI